MKGIFSVLVENKDGVLSQISGLFARRGFNIDSLTVSATDDPAISRITIVVHDDAKVLEQIIKQQYQGKGMVDPTETDIV